VTKRTGTPVITGIAVSTLVKDREGAPDPADALVGKN
jgi:hypothetical protein